MHQAAIQQGISPREVRTSSVVADRVVVTVLMAAYLLLICAGYLMLRDPEVMPRGQELSYDRACFLAVNAATLTGFEQAIGVREFSLDSSKGNFAVMGLVTGGILISTIIGGLAVVRIVGLPYSTLQVVIASVTSLVLAVLIGAVGIVRPGVGLYDAVFQSAAAYGNCGLATGRFGSELDGHTYLMLVLATAGGLGLPVLMELYDLLLGRRHGLTPHSRMVLSYSSWAYLAGFVVFALLQFPGVHAPWEVWQQAAAGSSVASLNTRTAGLHIEAVSALPLSAHWVMMLLMAVGANSGGTGGGLKGTTIVQLFQGTRDVLRGRRVSRGFGIAMVWLSVYVAIVVLGLVVINGVERELPGERLLFVVISAASNVGLSHDAISVVGPTLYLLSAVMLAGRIAPFAILWWMASTTKDAELAIG